VVLSIDNGSFKYADYDPIGLNLVIAATDKNAHLWNRETLEHLVLSGHTAALNYIDFSPDRKQIITTATDKTARLWETESGYLLKTLSGHTSDLNYATFSPNNTVVLTASNDNTARLWDAISGEQLLILGEHDTRVNDATFSPSGTKIATAANNLYIWDANNNSTLAAILKNQNQRLTSNTTDITDSESNNTVHKLQQPFVILNGDNDDKKGFKQVTFSTDERYLAAISAKKVFLWRVSFEDTQALMEYALKLAPEPLSKQQRQDFLLED
jgi:WD40 repeat protein